MPLLGETPMTTMLNIFGYSLLLVAVALCGIIVYVSLLIYRVEEQCKHVPGPKSESFFFGHVLSIVAFKKKTNLSWNVQLHRWSLQYGLLFWIRMLHRPIFFASSPELVKELLLNSSHPKPIEIYTVFHSIFGQRFMGYGLVSETNHPKWHQRRALMNPAFHRRYLMGMMDHFNDAADALSQQLLKKADGKTEVTMLDELSSVTLDIIAKIGFDLNTGATNDPLCPFPSAISLALRGMQASFETPWTLWDPRGGPRKFRSDVRDAIKLVRRIGRQCIEDRVAAMQRGDDLPKDILTYILQASDNLKDDENFGIEEMLDEFMTFFVAGQETTSNLLAFTLQQLGRHPEVAERLQVEVDEVFGQKPFIEYGDLAKLEYMMRVLKETLRLYPPISGSTRLPSHDIVYNGIKIPAGVNVLVMWYLMARREEYFDDPLLFNPDRFVIKEGELPRHLYAYLPFSMGQRSCIGQHLALMEAKVILSKLLQRFKFRLEQSQRFITNDELTMKPLDRCKNYITVRE